MLLLDNNFKTRLKSCIWTAVLLLLSQRLVATSPINYNLIAQHGYIECILHRDSTLLFDFDKWRGAKITLQPLPVVRGTAIKVCSDAEEDTLLLHRADDALYVTIRSSALTLRCQYNTWGMFSFEFMVFNGRYMLSSINMNECEEIVDDALTTSILDALEIL